VPGRAKAATAFGETGRAAGRRLKDPLRHPSGEGSPLYWWHGANGWAFQSLPEQCVNASQPTSNMRRCGPGARARRHRQPLGHGREEGLHLPTARAQQRGAARRAEGVRLERRQREVEWRTCACTCTCGVVWQVCGVHALSSVSKTARPRQTRPTARWIAV
jgi:hypothetical protein